MRGSVAQDSARAVSRFLENCFVSLTIDSRAGNAFPDTPRKFTLLSSAEHVLEDAINNDRHNLLLREEN